MISLRLRTLAQLVKPQAKVIDIGTDHGLLGIYLLKNRLATQVLATDIKASAINQAIKNITQSGYHIETQVADGLKNLNMAGYDTIVIAGLGGLTITNILFDHQQLKNISYIILQPTNKIAEVRNFMAQRGYYLVNEIVINERNKYYVSMCYQKSKRKNSLLVQRWGLANNQEYIKHLLNKRRETLTKLTPQAESKKNSLSQEINDLIKIINKQ